MSNTANIASTGTTDLTPGNNSSTATTAVTTQADVTVVKAGPLSVIAGNQITYTVTISDPGPSDAQNVSLADTLPVGTTFVNQTQPNTGPQFTLTHTGNAITDTLATLTVGTSQTFTITATINSNAPAGTLSNTATATTTTSDPKIGTDGTSTASTNVTTQADVTVVKTGPMNAIAGNQITYTVTIQTNVGPSDAQGVSLADTLPAGTTFVNQTQPNTGPQFTLTHTGNAITDTITTLAAGATQTFTITAAINPNTPRRHALSNTATATTTTSEPQPGHHQSSGHHLDRFNHHCRHHSQSDVTVVKTGPMNAIAGNQITYTVTISDPGPSDAQNVSLADTLPVGTTFVNQTQPNTGPQFTLTHTGNAITDTLATLAAGATQTITITAAINSSTPAGIISNTATATTTTSDPNIGTDGTSTASTNVTTQADHGRAQDRPDHAIAGNQVTYTVTVTNVGPSDAQNVTMTDPSPQQHPPHRFHRAEHRPAVHPHRPQHHPHHQDRDARRRRSQTFTITTTVAPSTPAGTLAATQRRCGFTTSEPNPDTTNPDTSTVNTTVSTQSDVTVLKTGPMNAIAGNQITYTVAISNPGPSDAQGVSLADTLPAGTTFVNQTQPNTGPQFTLGHTGNAITDTITTLAAGATQTITITAAINANTPAGTLSNTATATTDTTDPNIASDGTSTASTTVTTQADVTVLKTGPTTAIAGNQITYTVAISNPGPSDAQGVSLADTLPRAPPW